MKPISIFAVFVLFLVSLQQVSAATPPDGSKAILNGEDLRGWHGLNPHSVVNLEGEARKSALKKMREEFADYWYVENGELINNGEGPYACTNADYGNIELLIDYKITAGADSGIYLRGTPQVQIWDKDPKYHTDRKDRGPHLGSGGLFNNTLKTLGRNAIRTMDKPAGQWNTFRVIQIGSRTWVWLNTRPIVEGTVMENYWDREKPLPPIGPIMLQTHGGEIRFRNIFVREIGAEEGKRFLEDNPPLPNPDFFDVPYGTHARQVMHFWKADSDKPTPLLLFIHGGGWGGGGRLSGLSEMLNDILDAGISVASIEYRFIADATADGLIPPVKGPMYDSARALQFIRSKATEWNIDKERIAASGGSAGACTSLWLAFHPDLAQPESDDPIARESTRLYCAAVNAAQTSLDPKQMKEWTPNSRYGAHAFGIQGDDKRKLSAFDVFLRKRDSIQPWIAEYSPYALVSSDDPQVYLYYSTPPALGQDQEDPTHTSNFGIKLYELCQEKGVQCELFYPGKNEGVLHSNVKEYLIEMLKSG